MTAVARRALYGVLLIGMATVLLTDTGERRATTSAARPVAIATLPCHGGPQSTSSGFLVADQLVVTVAHAIFESRDFAVRDVAGEWHHATIEHLDLARDLALLRVGDLRATPVLFAAARADDPVRMLEGAASGTVGGSVIRRVNMRTNILGGDDASLRLGYELALEITPGDSGAAIIDDDGRLVAIVFARSTRLPSVTWSTSVDEVRAVLGRGEIPSWDCGPDLGVELELPPPAEEDVLRG